MLKSHEPCYKTLMVSRVWVVVELSSDTYCSRRFKPSLAWTFSYGFVSAQTVHIFFFICRFIKAKALLFPLSEKAAYMATKI